MFFMEKYNLYFLPSREMTNIYKKIVTKNNRQNIKSVFYKRMNSVLTVFV